MSYRPRLFRAPDTSNSAWLAIQSATGMEARSYGTQHLRLSMAGRLGERSRPVSGRQSSLSLWPDVVEARYRGGIRSVAASPHPDRRASEASHDSGGSSRVSGPYGDAAAGLLANDLCSAAANGGIRAP